MTDEDREIARLLNDLDVRTQSARDRELAFRADLQKRMEAQNALTELRLR